MHRLSIYFFSLSSIFLISLFTLYPSFNLALFGDDWLVIHRYVTDVGSISAGFSKHLKEYLSPYGPPQVVMGILKQLFEYNSTLYYITSYFFRLFAAFSLFPITYYLTRNKLSAFFAVLFFSVTTTGFDTTNWVFNMTSYLAIGFISLFLFFYVKSKEERKIILLIPAAILFYLAYITASIRMHATLFLLILLEVFWLVRERNLRFARNALIRLASVVIVILFIRSTGVSLGQPTEAIDRFREGINTFQLLLSQGQFDFLVYPLASFGSIFIPDSILPFTGQVSSTKNLIINIILPILLIFIIVSRFLIKLTVDSKKGIFLNFYTPIIIWTIIVIIFYRGNTITSSSATYNSLLLIGGYILILGLMFIIKNLKLKFISTLLIMSFSWIMFSYLYAWLWRPELYLTVHRYLIVGAAAAAIFLSSLISLGKSKYNQIKVFLMFVPLLIMHIYSTRMYETQLVTFGHGQETFNKIWASIPYMPQISEQKEVSIFYFEGDGTNGSILHDSINFGFSPHMALLYNINEPNRIPLTMDSWNEVVSAVKDGKSFIRHYGVAKNPIPVNNVYVFKLEGKDKLIDISPQAREMLLKMP